MAVRRTWVDRAVAGYRRLLVMLPAARRRRDGDEMVALFRRLAYEAHGRGGARGVVGVWLRSAADLFTQSVRARCFRGRPAPSPAARGAAGGAGLVTASPLSPYRSNVENTSRNRSGIVDTLWLDLRFGVRSLLRRPAFALLACATFALGLGATTAIFGLVDAVLLRPLPYTSPDRIVRLMGTRRGEVNLQGTLSYANAMDVKERSRTLGGVAAYDEWRPNLTGVGEPELVDAATVNADFFDVLGVTPAAGRFFREEEDIDGRDRVVVLAHGFWQRRFGGEPAIVGTTIALNGNPHTVVGVAPAGFEDPKLSGPSWGDPQLWRPLGFGGLSAEAGPSRGSSSYVAIARLAPGATLEAARSELEVLSARLEREFPDANTGVGMALVPIRESIVGDVRASLLLLLAAVGVLLAIAAANVGNLLLGRAAERRREVALRVALGASRGRVVRQIVTETLVLALVGGAAGTAVALVGTRSIVALGEQFVPRGTDLTVNATVLGFALVVTLLTGLLCGLFPALSAASADLRGSLGETDRGGTHGRRSVRLRSGLIAAEVALALLLLVGAGLLAKSLWQLMRVDVGIEPTNVLTFELSPPLSSYPDDESVTAFYAALLEQLAALPGAERVAGVNIAPLTGSFDGNTLRPVDRPEPPPGQRLSAEVRTVTPGYFATVELALREGRLLEDSDRAGAPTVAVISEALARTVWPDENPLGKRFATIDTVVEVVGVVADVKHMRLDESSPPMFYVARAQAVVPWHGRRMTVVLRTAEDAAVLAPAVRATVRALDPQLPLANLRTMEEVIARSAAPPRFRTLLLGSFSALAVLLAALGIYGVVSFSVTQRGREMAIRMALGARRRRVIGLVIQQGLAPVGAGMALGLLGAFALARVLDALLFEVTALDASVFLGVPALMLAIAAFACGVPAHRATRADPMTVLREE